MNDQEAPRPLTRRERRLQEMPETGQFPAVDPQADVAKPGQAGSGDEVFVSPYDEEGRPRTRREIRELRQQMLASLGLSENAANDTGQFERAIAETRVEEAPQAPAEPVIQESPAVPVAPQPEEVPEELDPWLAATQAFSTEDLRDAELPRRQRAEEAFEAAASAELETDIESAADEAEAEAVAPHTPADEAPVEAEAPAEEDAPMEPPTSGYSFPDIAPLEENISVFDDPSVRTVATPIAPRGVGGGDFDDLISRAVAQEGAASTSNTSALILPHMPDTSDLSGPLGGTGELFVTGSIELPRSLGETGGHSALHDAIDADPIEELGFEVSTASTSDLTQPVSAVRAVSARSTLGPVVTETKKERSKLPIALISTGGVLVVGLAALFVWAAVSGMFG